MAAGPPRERVVELPFSPLSSTPPPSVESSPPVYSPESTPPRSPISPPPLPSPSNAAHGLQQTPPLVDVTNSNVVAAYVAMAQLGVPPPLPAGSQAISPLDQSQRQDSVAAGFILETNSGSSSLHYVESTAPDKVHPSKIRSLSSSNSSASSSSNGKAKERWTANGRVAAKSRSTPTSKEEIYWAKSLRSTPTSRTDRVTLLIQEVEGYFKRREELPRKLANDLRVAAERQRLALQEAEAARVVAKEQCRGARASAKQQGQEMLEMQARRDAEEAEVQALEERSAMLMYKLQEEREAESELATEVVRFKTELHRRNVERKSTKERLRAEIAGIQVQQLEETRRAEEQLSGLEAAVARESSRPHLLRGFAGADMGAWQFAMGLREPGGWLGPSLFGPDVGLCALAWLPRAIFAAWVAILADQKREQTMIDMEERVLRKSSVRSRAGGTSMAMLQATLRSKLSVQTVPRTSTAMMSLSPGAPKA